MLIRNSVVVVGINNTVDNIFGALGDLVRKRDIDDRSHLISNVALQARAVRLGNVVERVARDVNLLASVVIKEGCWNKDKTSERCGDSIACIDSCAKTATIGELTDGYLALFVDNILERPRLVGLQSDKLYQCGGATI